MKIAYNPKNSGALTTAPVNNDITFDLSGLAIYAKGIKFKGTDTTYSIFKKHTSNSGGGYNGLVPVPSYNNNSRDRYLREDGTWTIPTDTKVYQSKSTASEFRPVILGADYSTDKNAINDPITAQVYTAANIYCQPSTGFLYANKFIGRIDWNNIDGKPSSFNPTPHTHPYLPLSGGTMTGSINISTNAAIQWYRNTDQAKIYFKNDSDSDTDSYMAFQTGDNGNEYFKFSGQNSSTITTWMTIKSNGVTANNFIGNLIGNSSSATKLQTARTINGVPFDGTKNITISASPTSHNHNDLYYQKSESDSRYVNITGDTMIGRLNIKGDAAQHNLITRGVVGSDGNGTISSLYLQYQANNKIYLGNTAAHYISEGGDYYSGRSNLANTTTKLQTPRRIWGQSFDGTKDINGDFIVDCDTLKYKIDYGGYNIMVTSRVQGWSRGLDVMKFEDGSTLSPIVGALGSGHSIQHCYFGGRSWNDAAIYAKPNKYVGIDNSEPREKLDITGYVLSAGYKKGGSSDSYVLLGGGGHKSLNEIANKTHYHDSLTTNYKGGVQHNPQTYFDQGKGLKVAMTGHWKSWSDTLWVNGYSGSDVLNMCALHFMRDGTPRLGISTQKTTATEYGTIYEIWSKYNLTKLSQLSNDVGFITSAQISNYYWANLKITSSPNAYTTPTFNNLYLTSTSGSHMLLMGNQNSAGVNKPAIINAANGNLYLGYGNSWNGGGTLTTVMQIGTSVQVNTPLNVSSYVTSTGFKKNGSSDSYILLGGGGHKSVNDFVTTNTTQTIIGLKTFTQNIRIYKTTSQDTSFASSNPSIEFASDGGNQAVKLMYTNYNSYRPEAGLKVVGFNNASNIWFEAPQFIKTGSSNNYVLLGGGSHKAISDFAIKTHTHSWTDITNRPNGLNSFMQMSSNCRITIEVGGDLNTYYPVRIKTLNDTNENLNIITVAKSLGGKFPNWPGNHPTSGSSCIYKYAYRTSTWDGNGDILKTLHAWYGYAPVVADVQFVASPSTGLVIWLRGGGASYAINCTNPIEVNIYYTKTNLYTGSSDYAAWVEPRTSIGNAGINNNSKVPIEVKKSTLSELSESSLKLESSDKTIRLYTEFNNEINFGGTHGSNIICFGYRAKDAKPIPAVFVFGSNSGTAQLKASKFTKTGSSDSYMLLGGGGHRLVSDFSYKSYWHWAGQSGQPTWLWGGNSENNYYVYNPSNFRVSYAKDAGNSDTLDGYHLYNVVYGQSSYGSTNIKSLNDLNRCLFFRDNNGVVGNTGTTGLFVSHVNTSAYGFALACDYSTDLIYFKRKTNGSWGNTKRLAFITDIPTKLSQLTNDKGYITSYTNNYLTGVSGSGNGTVTFSRNGLSSLTWNASHEHSRIRITDNRGQERSTAEYPAFNLSTFFNDYVAGLHSWRSGITIKGWSNDYQTWQLIGGSSTYTEDEWYLRAGRNSQWHSACRIWHSKNLSKLSQLSNDLGFVTSSHTHNMNNITDAADVTVSSGTTVRKVFITNTKSGDGFRSRVALGLTNPSSKFSPAILSVGTNDAGTTWQNYIFGADGKLTVPYGIDNNGGQITTASVQWGYDPSYCGGLVVREKTYGGTLDTNWFNAPGITLHWAGRSVGKLGLNYDGKLRWRDDFVLMRKDVPNIVSSGNRLIWKDHGDIMLTTNYVEDYIYDPTLEDGLSHNGEFKFVKKDNIVMGFGHALNFSGSSATYKTSKHLIPGPYEPIYVPIWEESNFVGDLYLTNNNGELQVNKSTIYGTHKNCRVQFTYII